jgi:hypothetical protein
MKEEENKGEGKGKEGKQEEKRKGRKWDGRKKERRNEEGNKGRERKRKQTKTAAEFVTELKKNRNGTYCNACGWSSNGGGYLQFTTWR